MNTNSFDPSNVDNKMSNTFGQANKVICHLKNVQNFKQIEKMLAIVSNKLLKEHVEGSHILVAIDNSAIKNLVSKVGDKFLYNMIGRFYSMANGCEFFKEKRDLRLWLESFKPSFDSASGLQKLFTNSDTVFIDHNLRLYIDKQQYSEIASKFIQLSICNSEESSNSSDNFLTSSSLSSEFQSSKHDTVVLGGTFDRLHNGHKFLLSAAAFLAKHKVICGVTVDSMLERKILYELIQPAETRVAGVSEFLNSVDSTIAKDVVLINDPFGPTVDLAELDAIVVSQETVRGAHRINEERTKRNMKELKIYVIDIIEDDLNPDDKKSSSSKIRKDLLGSLLVPSKKIDRKCSDTYVVGLTGGTNSGKTHIAQYLQEFGAEVIDCDKLGHQAYSVGTEAYFNIIKTFGEIVLDKVNGNTINRKVLGSIVFSNKDSLQKLNAIVWPEIVKLCNEKIEQCKKRGQKIVVLDAAVLLEAGWDNMVDEIWTSIVPTAEAIRRLQERNALNEKEATQRVHSQLTNSQRIKKSNVVFCSLWSYSYTKSQVRKAWDNLLERLKA